MRQRSEHSSEPARFASGEEVQQQLTKLEAQFELLASRVRQAQQLASLGTAATMIAHEVNNLLTPILAYAEAAEQSNDPQLMKRALAVSARNVRILIGMSERVLNIGAAKSTTPRAAPVRQIVDDAVGSLCRDLSKDGITLHVDVEDGLTVWADPLQLQQVLFNLFLNAREAMAPSHSGRLKVSGERQNGSVMIRVHNTGRPIAADVLPHIFDPLQSTKPAGDSSPRCRGLGLALCRDLVESNGGTITVSSEAHSGTTFALVLPAKPR